jgi:hypothetical protein
VLGEWGLVCVLPRWLGWFKRNSDLDIAGISKVGLNGRKIASWSESRKLGGVKVRKGMEGGK